jgi:hypothetical protein
VEFGSLRILAAWFCLTVASASGAGADTAADMAAATLRDDFETGELNAWESYPIAEDPGFDPEIWCVREPSFHGSAYSLCKVIKPNDTDYPVDRNLVGMTKKIRIRTGAGSAFSLAAFMDGDRRAEELRVVLYGADGARYTWSREKPPANEWVEVSAPAADFKAGSRTLAPGVWIEAVSVTARYGPVNPHRSYSLCIDDFSLSGETVRRFVAVKPESVWLDKFSLTILTRHFHRGETFFLSVRPEDGGRPVRLVSLTCTVYDPNMAIRAKNVTLSDNGENGDASGGDGVWSSASIYRIAEGDPAGRWRLSLDGVGSGGERVRNDLFVLVPEKRLTPDDHPRLFFTRAELDSLKAGAADPKRKKIFDAAVSSARNTVARGKIDDIVEAGGANLEFLDGGPVSPTWDYYSRWSRPGTIMREVVTAGAFLYALDGDREAGLKAKEFMLRFAAFKEWQNPWFLEHHMYGYYPVGLWSYAMGIGYDLLYPLFTPEERITIRKAVMEKALIPHYRDHVELNRKPSNITNHIGMNTTGILLCALAFIGEDPENPDMEPYLSGILAKYKAHIDAAYRPDSSYAEPESYAGTDSEDLVKCLDALERNLGLDWTTTTDVRGAYLYQLYLATANGKDCPAFGDGGRDWGFSLRNLHLWLAHRTKDPSALERYLWQTESGAFPPYYTFFDYLWMPDGGIEPKPLAERPLSRWFKSKGNVVFRSGWDENATIFAMKCGPHSNHYHLDQGTFWLLSHGETLITEAGVVNYYRNLYYRSFYIQPVGHNTLLLNRYPESQRIADLDDEVKARSEFPRITSCFTGTGVNEVEGDLASVYKDRLSRYTRSFVYMRPDYLVLFDEVDAQAPEQCTWVFHAEGKDSFKGDGATVRIVRPKAELRMEVLAPSEPGRTVNPYPDRDASFIYLTDPMKARSSRFLAVLIPSSPESRSEHESWETARVETDGWTGAEIRRGSEIDHVLFRTGVSSSVNAPGGFSTGGDRIAATTGDGGALHRLWVRRALSCALNGGTIFASTATMTVSLEFGAHGCSAETEADSAAIFSLKTGKKPDTVSMNGKKTTFTFDRKTGNVAVSLPAGRNTIEMNSH